jgi:hypothetical protein
MNPNITPSFQIGHDMGTFFMNLVEEATKQACRIYFEMLKELLVKYWLNILIFLLIAFVFGLVKYVTTGRWSTLGSFLYHLFNLTTLFLIAYLLGPEIFVSDYFPIVLTIVYSVCFAIVGRIFKRREF